MPCEASGTAAWKDGQTRRGLESDACFCLTDEKIAKTREAVPRKSNSSADFSAPDLAIELDFWPSAVDREEIYAALDAPEVWKYDGERLRIGRRGSGGVYEAMTASPFLKIRIRGGGPPAAGRRG